MSELKKEIAAIKGTKKKATAAMGLGITSLLTIMAVLLLTSFAMLSLLSANSDMLLSEKAAQAVKDYYNADSQAEEWWQKLNEIIDAGEEGSVSIRLNQAGYKVEPVDGDYIVREEFAMSEKKNLEVVAEVSADGKAAILLWQSVPVYTPSAP